MQVWIVLLLSPAPVLLLTSDHPLFGQLLIVAFVIAAILYAKPKPLEQPAGPLTEPRYATAH
jgi:hypothetical protein